MKKTVFLPCILALFLSLNAFPSVAHADDAWSKLGRGVANTLFGWCEIFKQPMEMAEKDPWPVATFGGLFKGLAMTLVRTSAGVYEIISFPIPWPNGYDPIMDPEFVFRTYPSTAVEIPA